MAKWHSQEAIKISRDLINSRSFKVDPLLNFVFLQIVSDRITDSNFSDPQKKHLAQITQRNMQS
jgi:hypothetical protein